MALEKIRPGVVDDTQNFVFNNVTATGNLTASNANLGNIALANYLTGTLTTSAQPNITSIGTLGNLTVTSNVSAGNILTNNLLYANGSPWQFGGGNGANVAGSNTQVQFNDGGTFGASANFTFDKTTNTLSVTNFVGSGSGLSNLSGSNISGQVANALIAGTVYTASQPNITSIGTLGNLTVSNSITANAITVKGTKEVVNYFTGTGTFSSATLDANLGTLWWISNPTSMGDPFTINFGNVANSTTDTTVFIVMVEHGATPHAITNIQVNGASPYVKWLGGISPVATANTLDVYSFTIIPVTGRVLPWIVTAQYNTYA